jgi:hypothetical protein
MISASQVAGITAVNHNAWLIFFIELKDDYLLKAVTIKMCWVFISSI